MKYLLPVACLLMIAMSVAVYSDVSNTESKSQGLLHQQEQRLKAAEDSAREAELYAAFAQGREVGAGCMADKITGKSEHRYCQMMKISYRDAMKIYNVEFAK